jgi:bifunctional non-homologous end joining protein LigD
MALEEYAAKRKFENTPEPEPGAARSAGNSFCVQRHNASRLHYDFRLEMNGVLKSWAIPKGPTLDPGVKHLAAMVEDHPLEYGGFEGNIPAGNYGAGSVMLWDRGEYELVGEALSQEQLARGDLKFRLHGEKLNGEFALVLMKGRGKGNEWLIIKKRDQYAAPGWDIEDYAYSALSGRTQQEIAQDLPARSDKRKTAGAADRVWKSSRKAARNSPPAAAAAPAPVKKKIAIDLDGLEGARKAAMPTAIQPMKATLATEPPRGNDWLFEIKWDGVRAIAWIDGEQAHLQSRTGIRCEKQYPELAVIPHYVAARQAILDGEIAVLDETGVSRFHLIQPRIANSDPAAIARLAKTTPVVYLVFDLLYLDGYDLRGVALRERKNLLRQALTETPVLKISADFAGSGEELLAAAREHGLEGIVAKRAGSYYESKRSREWLKIKIEGEQEFVIGGFTAPQGSREYFGALVLGVYENGALTWVGNVGTGFDQKSLAELYGKLEPLVTETCPFRERPKPDAGVRYVRPELVCQVKFTNWTPDGRLRAPVFLGLRNDVRPHEVAREQADPPAAASDPAPSGRIPEGKKEASLRVDGHSLKLTNLDKIFYPAEGYTKRDILDYYDSVADLILPHLKGRPLSLKRYPNGIQEEYFFQKDIPKTFASWLHTEIIPSDSERGVTRYVFAEDRASLLYLVNLGCIDHNPWMSRWPTLDNPDFVLIDLDPYECPFEMVVEAALLVKQVLDRVALQGYPKTTGGDGMHVYIPVETGYSYDDTRTFAELIGQLAFAERPEMFTTPRAVLKRQSKRVYFDYLQNGKSKTIAAPYVLRAHPGAPVATPLEWSEVKRGLSPNQFNISNAVERFAQTGDLFAPVLNSPQRLEEALEEVEKLFRKPRKSAS